MFIIRYSIAICLRVIFFLLSLFTSSMFTQRRGTMTRIEVREVEFRIVIRRLFVIGETRYIVETLTKL